MNDDPWVGPGTTRRGKRGNILSKEQGLDEQCNIGNHLHSWQDLVPFRISFSPAMPSPWLDRVGVKTARVIVAAAISAWCPEYRPPAPRLQL